MEVKFPGLKRDMDLQIKIFTVSRTNEERSRDRHIIMKFQNAKDEEIVLKSDIDREKKSAIQECDLDWYLIHHQQN